MKWSDYGNSLASKSWNLRHSSRKMEKARQLWCNHENEFNPYPLSTLPIGCSESLFQVHTWTTIENSVTVWIDGIQFKIAKSIELSNRSFTDRCCWEKT